MLSNTAQRPEALTTTIHRLGEVAVLTLTGRLDTRSPFVAGQSVERALGHIDACLANRPRAIIVDLLGAEPTRFVVSLLGLVRRRAERLAVPLVLTAPTAFRELLEEIQVASLYSIHPSLSLALERAHGATEVEPHTAAVGVA
jgi:hypothetical protein